MKSNECSVDNISYIPESTKKMLPDLYRIYLNKIEDINAMYESEQYVTNNIPYSNSIRLLFNKYNYDLCKITYCDMNVLLHYIKDNMYMYFNEVINKPFININNKYHDIYNTYMHNTFTQKNININECTEYVNYVNNISNVKYNMLDLAIQFNKINTVKFLLTYTKLTAHSLSVSIATILNNHEILTCMKIN